MWIIIWGWKAHCHWLHLCTAHVHDGQLKMNATEAAAPLVLLPASSMFSCSLWGHITKPLRGLLVWMDSTLTDSGSSFRGVNEKSRLGFRFILDVTLIIDEGGDGELRESISPPYNLPLHTQQWLLTFLYTWEEWEWAPGTAQTHLMHISWWLPQWDERNQGCNTRKSVENEVASFSLLPFPTLGVCVLSQGLNNPHSQTRDHPKKSVSLSHILFKNRIPLLCEFTFLHLPVCSCSFNAFFNFNRVELHIHTSNHYSLWALRRHKLGDSE